MLLVTNVSSAVSLENNSSILSRPALTLDLRDGEVRRTTALIQTEISQNVFEVINSAVSSAHYSSAPAH